MNDCDSLPQMDSISRLNKDLLLLLLLNQIIYYRWCQKRKGGKNLIGPDNPHHRFYILNKTTERRKQGPIYKTNEYIKSLHSPFLCPLKHDVTVNI